MVHNAAHLNAGVILVVAVYSDRYKPPLPPFLINLMVSVDVNPFTAMVSLENDQ